jgi:hypothetical protein
MFQIDTSVVYNKFTFNLKDDAVDYTMGFQEDHTDKIVRHFVQFMLGAGHAEAAIASAMREISDEYFDCQQSLMKQAQAPVLD